MIPIDLINLVKNLDHRSFRSPESYRIPKEFLGSRILTIEDVEIICPIKQEENSSELSTGGLEIPDGRNVWMLIKFAIKGVRLQESKIRCRLIIYNRLRYFNVGINISDRDYSTNDPQRLDLHMTDHGIYLTMSDKDALESAFETYGE